MSCKLKVVVSLLRIIATLLSLRPFGNIIYDVEEYLFTYPDTKAQLFILFFFFLLT